MDEYKITGQLKRELDSIDKKMKKSEVKKRRTKIEKEIAAKEIVDEITKKKGISSYFKNKQYIVKTKERGFARIVDRKNFVSVSMWEKGDKNFHTIRVKSNEEKKKALSELDKIRRK